MTTLIIEHHILELEYGKTINNQIKLIKKLNKEFIKKAGQLYIKFHYPAVCAARCVGRIKCYEDYIFRITLMKDEKKKIFWRAHVKGMNKSNNKFQPNACYWSGFYPKNTDKKYCRNIKTKREIAYMAQNCYYRHHQLIKPPTPAWFKTMKKKALLKYYERIRKEQEKEDHKVWSKVKMDCCICLTTKTQPKMIKSKTCSHSVCYKCYGDAFQGGNPIYKCPLCRANFGQISY